MSSMVRNVLPLWLALASATPAFGAAPEVAPPPAAELATEPVTQPAAPEPVTRRPVLVPAAAAIVPGVLLHGSGHFAAGDRPTAWRLLKVELVGFSALLVGGAALAVTGASRRTVEPVILTTAAGAGLLATSWLADLYGVLAPAGGAGAALRVLPSVEAQLGARVVVNPTVPGTFFLGPALDIRLAGWRISPGAWLPVDSDSDGDNHSQARFAAQVAYRFVGPRAAGAPPATDGSFVDVAAGVIHHRFSENGQDGVPGAAFDMTTFDVQLDGRLDLRRVASSLTGSFVEGAAGVGLGAYHYPVAGTTEANSLLVARFAFGFDIGHRAERWGQLRVFYDHRHDDFAGGVKMTGLGSGALGYFGADGTAFFSRGWGVRGEVQVGAAWVGGLAVVRRFGSVEL